MLKVQQCSMSYKYEATTSCKNIETLPQKNNLSRFKSLPVTGLWDIILTSPLPPIQSYSSKFWAWSCIASNFDKGWRGITSTRSWTGHLCQNTVQCLKYFCNRLSHLSFTSKGNFHVSNSQNQDYSNINK